MTYRVQPNQSATFLAECYKLRSERGRDAEADYARREHERVFGERPNITWGPSFVCARVAYKLLVDDPTVTKTETAVRRSKVIIYHPDQAIGADWQAVNLLDKHLSTGGKTMTKEKKAATKATETENKTNKLPGKTKATIVGHPASSVFRWMGANGYTPAHARAMVQSMGIDTLKDSTIVTGVNDGKHGDKYGPVAELTPAEEKELKRHIPAALPTPVKRSPSKLAETTSKKLQKVAQAVETPAPVQTTVPAKKAPKKAVKKASV